MGGGYDWKVVVRYRGGWRVNRKRGEGGEWRESYIQKLRWSLYTPMYSYLQMTSTLQSTVYTLSDVDISTSMISLQI